MSKPNGGMCIHDAAFLGGTAVSASLSEWPPDRARHPSLSARLAERGGSAAFAYHAQIASRVWLTARRARVLTEEADDPCRARCWIDRVASRGGDPAPRCRARAGG